MDIDSLFNGFAGAVLTAIVALAGPYLARSYALRVINRTPAKTPLPAMAGFIVEAFGAVEIPNARRFSVRDEEAYSDPHLNLWVGYGSTPSGKKGIFTSVDHYMNVHLPGQSEPELVEDLRVAWGREFEDDSTLYKLTLLAKSYDKLTFELRVLSEAHAEEGASP